jgi:prolipoprotein diacylglyceryltransferase
MIGGGAEDPSQFNGDTLFSSTRITLSPVLIVVGYIIIFYAIMKRPKKDTPSDKEA